MPTAVFFTFWSVFFGLRAMASSPPLRTPGVMLVMLSMSRCVATSTLATYAHAAHRTTVSSPAVDSTTNSIDSPPPIAPENASAANAVHLADLHERTRRAEQRLVEVGEQVSTLEKEKITEVDVRAAFADFENVWAMLSPKEQARLLALLVARVEYDAAAGTVSVTFHPTGIKALQQQALEEAA